MSAAAQLRITRLATQPAVHRAFRWLHLHAPQMRRWLLEMLAIPAPPFGERPRAEWFVERFRALGLEGVGLDGMGNAVGELPADDGRTSGPVVLLSAHLDTVFPAGTATAAVEEEARVIAPGACDNAAGLSGLLAIAAAMQAAELRPKTRVVLAANVGEEGEGDLRGMRYLFRESRFAGRIAAAIALEGGGASAVITRALASRRYRVSVAGPGGHSWMDAGAPNPIMLLARALVEVESAQRGMDAERLAHGDARRRTTLNVGLISGGTSVNSIPESAAAHLDLRSTDGEELERLDGAVREAIAAAMPEQQRWALETIGDRPGGCLPEGSGMMATLRAVDRHLNLRTEPGLGSTDANIPLSMGIPAIAMGAGGVGGGIHTLQEWYDPTGREAGLRRVLLTLLDTAQQVAEGMG